jgi:hypothetical protein
MTDYSEMSDFEVNKAVAFHIGLTTYRNAEEGSFNPCNNPADAWPIIVKNRIHIDPPLRDFHPWKADRGIAFQCQHDNPLRAAMVVFLKLIGAENADS